MFACLLWCQFYKHFHGFIVKHNIFSLFMFITLSPRENSVFSSVFQLYVIESRSMMCFSIFSHLLPQILVKNAFLLSFSPLQH